MEENNILDSEALELTETETPTESYGSSTVVNVMPSSEVVSRTVEIDPYVGGEGGALVSVVNTVFGDYQPRTQTVTEVLSDGSTVTYTETIEGLAGLDWYWLGGVLIFCIVLLSFFKLLGSVFKGR